MTIPQHAGLYSISQPATPSLPLFPPPKRTNIKKYDNIFHTLNDLIDLNECDILINKQKKEDSHKEHTHKLALIIRKNETKHDSATFLTVACFNPVKFTLLQAIKNNHFITWPSLSKKSPT